MRKTALTFSLVAACLSLGNVAPGVATPVQIAQRIDTEFQGWDFYPSNISYLSSNGRTEARMILNIRNLKPYNASLSGSEINHIRRVILVDAQGNGYRSSQFEPKNKSLNASFFFGETAMIQLSFFTPVGLHPRYLEIERSQGEPIRLPL